MNSAVVKSLLDLNREFYTSHGRDFSETRQRLQPGVVRMMDAFTGSESILDLGCGNGEFARALSNRDHQGTYLGLDISAPLLAEAQLRPFRFPVRFQEMDLVDFPSLPIGSLGGQPFDVITMFAFLHHIPGDELRQALIQHARQLLKPHGQLLLSNWQFLNSPRLKSRVQPWEAAGLYASDVDLNDYILDWKRGGVGLRYVHHFDLDELAKLASDCNFKITRKFYSDGQNGKLGLYQSWQKT